LITEFAPADWKAKTVEGNRHTQAKVLDFAREALPWLEEQEWIAGYSWFSFKVDEPVGTSSALFNLDMSLTALGRYYASVTTENPQGDPTIEARSSSPTSEVKCPSYPAPEPLPGKRGVCFTLRPEGQDGSWVENLPKVLSVNPYWNYAWAQYRIEAQPADIEYAPMLWGYKDTKQELWELLSKDVIPYIESGATKRILGFNEPDKDVQSNMTVEGAVELWPALEKLSVPLVSPSCAYPEGAWMEAFMKIANKKCLRIDWIGVHWYGGVDVTKFQDDMQFLYIKYGKPLLITEFSPADWQATTVEENRHTQAEVLKFAKQVLPWLEEQEWIVGYSWFSFKVDEAVGTSSALFDLDGSLTALGRYYASVTTQNPRGDLTIKAPSVGALP